MHPRPLGTTFFAKVFKMNFASFGIIKFHFAALAVLVDCWQRLRFSFPLHSYDNTPQNKNSYYAGAFYHSVNKVALASMLGKPLMENRKHCRP
jgi:hypothetical protein